MKILRELSKPASEKIPEEERFHRNRALDEIKDHLNNGDFCSFVAISDSIDPIKEYGTVHGTCNAETLVYLQIAFEKQILMLIERVSRINPQIIWGKCLFCNIRQPTQIGQTFRCYNCQKESHILGQI